MPWRSEIAALQIPGEEPKRRKAKATATVQTLHARPFGAYPLPGFPDQIPDHNGTNIAVAQEDDADLVASMHNLFTESRTQVVGGLPMAPLAIYRITYPANNPLVQKYQETANFFQMKLPKKEVLNEVGPHDGAFTNSTRFLKQYLDEKWAKGEDPLQSRWYPAANEQLLMHCTTWGRLGQIIGTGFQGHSPAVAASTGSRFGKGNYFADDIALANQYSDGKMVKDLPWATDRFGAHIMGGGGRMVPDSLFGGGVFDVQQAVAALQPLSYIGLNPERLEIRPVLFSRVLLGTPAIVNDSSYAQRKTKDGRDFCDKAACPPPGNGYTSIIRIGGQGGDQYRQFITFEDGTQLPTHLAFYTTVPRAMAW